MLVKLSHPQNALSPILVTLSGIVMLVKLLHPQYSPHAILVPMFILVKPLRPENAPLPMLVTLPSVGMALVLHPAISVLLAVLIIQLPVLWYTEFSSSTISLVKQLHPENA